ncbi:DNA end-binding protein Ku [Mumia flava]|uniref:Non-homologous end joining protein Ku n=1 Tax=Mumia flava TaxID=1348852 RepID=A0A0B2B7A0_9ACTN|nr:Ku protein [Mumia flava]PJJ57689.1 DNA end-binding protein Ku [Mumia flava]
MRAMWKGTVSFGLVSIPVRMYGATSTHDISFRQVRASDGSRVRFRRVAEADGETVEYSEIAKGYELPDGRMIILTDEDMAELPLPTKKTVEVLEFVPLDQVDPILYNKSYYLEPESKPGVKPYLLLREALESSEMVAVVKVTIGTREQMATIRVRDGVLTMSTLLWADEIRKPEFSFLDEDNELRPQEVKMAQSLVASMESDFDLEEFTDDYQVALDELVAAKLEGNEVVAPAAAESAGGDSDNVVDLMAALQASIDRAKKGEGPTLESSPAADSGADEDSDDASGSKTAAKKTAAKKSTAKSAKKAPAKKTAAKKSAAKKSTSKKSAAKKSAAKRPAKKSA